MGGGKRTRTSRSTVTRTMGLIHVSVRSLQNAKVHHVAQLSWELKEGVRPSGLRIFYSGPFHHHRGRDLTGFLEWPMSFDFNGKYKNIAPF